mgnify:CR=1 FL=1
MFFLQFIYLLSLSLWIGALIFFSFIAAPAIFKTLPHETAGDVVGNIFPKYYQLGCLCAVLSLGSLALLSAQSNAWHEVRIMVLAFMTLITFYSAFVIGPKVRQLKTTLRAMKNQPAYAEKSKRFSRLHGFSMVLNLLVLIAGIVLLFLTALDFQ